MKSIEETITIAKAVWSMQLKIILLFIKRSLGTTTQPSEEHKTIFGRALVWFYCFIIASSGMFETHAGALKLLSSNSSYCRAQNNHFDYDVFKHSRRELWTEIVEKMNWNDRNIVPALLSSADHHIRTKKPIN